MPLAGLINLKEERKRLEAEKARLEGEVARCEKMLSNPGFVNKAPQAKIDQEKEKLEKYKEMLEKVKENLKQQQKGCIQKDAIFFVDKSRKLLTNRQNFLYFTLGKKWKQYYNTKRKTKGGKYGIKILRRGQASGF